MLYDAVPKCSCENLTIAGTYHHKAETRRRLVSTLQYLSSQSIQVILVTDTVFNALRGGFLVPATVQISINPLLQHFFTECDHAPDLVGVVLVVVVERTITEIDVPRIVVTILSGTPVVRGQCACYLVLN